MFAYVNDAASSEAGQAYKCPFCDNQFAGHDVKTIEVATPGDVWRLQDWFPTIGHCEDGDCDLVIVETGKTVIIKTDDFEKFKAWYCGDGCLIHDGSEGPTLYDQTAVTVWTCGQCEEDYSSENYTDPEAAAVACCK